MLATGKIVRDYRPLMEYLRIINEADREKVLPRSCDIDLATELVSSGVRTLDELVNNLKEVLKDRINPEAAKGALERAWGFEADQEYAVEEISRELAGWIIELAERLGNIRLRGGIAD